MLSARENLLRAIFFQKPEWIPVVYSINPSYYFAMDAEEVPENGVELPETILLRVFTGADGECELIEDNGKLPCKGVRKVQKVR